MPSASECPAQLKMCLPYLQRAQELAARDPIVAYYCKAYAAQLGIQNLKQGDADATKYLTQLLDDLETEKPHVAHLSPEEARDYVNNYALMMFKKADDKERAGIGDKTTILLFFVSSVLMEVTKQFGELETDIAEKQKYAKWKAAEIKRHLDQGIPYQRSEAVGEPFEGTEQRQADQLSQPNGAFPAASAASFPSPPQTQPDQHPNAYGGYPQQVYQPPQPQGLPTNATPPYTPPYQPVQQPPPVQAYQPAPQAYAPPTAQPAYAAATVAAPSTVSAPVAGVDAIVEAQKFARYVVSALQFNDVPTALTNLHKALDLLEGRAQPRTR